MREYFAPKLSELTSLGFGGQCQLLLELQTRADLERLPGRLSELGLDWFVLGRGTNLFGLDGEHELVLVKANFADKPRVLGKTEAGQVLVQVGAGVPLPSFLVFCRQQGLSGLEGLSGIPGNIGGAVAMNAGSFGVSIGQRLHCVELWDSQHSLRTVPVSALELGYRHFALKDATTPVIVSAVFALDCKSKDEVQSAMQAVYAQKNERQPVRARSAGCVFKNPPGLSAGILLDRAGFRGRCRGSVAFSEKHANFLVNLGQGTATEALTLLNEARAAVYEQFAVKLEFEVRFVPCQRSLSG